MNKDLALEKLTLKVVALLALITGHRMQTLALIDIRNISRKSDRIEIKIPDRIKTSSLNKVQPLLVIPFYRKEVVICPATTVTDYIERTKELRGSEHKLFVSFKKPHKSVFSQSLSRRIKRVLSCSGIDTNYFSAYSTRHAFTSAVSRSDVNIDVIRKTAGWTRNSEVFAKLYCRELVNDTNEFALTILRK